MLMEFHISRNARERYKFAESLFSYNGNVILANMPACREFAYRMNRVRDVEKHPELAVHAGQLYAMGLIDEASHVLLARYREQFDPQVMTSALDWFGAQVGTDKLDAMLLAFVEQFPGIGVMRGEQTPAQWLAGQTGSQPHRAAALEELLLLWSANRNQAFKPFEELFEDKQLAERTVYRQVTAQMPEYFATRPLVPLPDAKPVSLLDLLRAPVTGAPASLSEQLMLIRKLWRPLLGDSLERILQLAGEILHEEELAIWMQFNPSAASAREAAERHRQTGQEQWPSVVSRSEVPVFGDPAHEYERFSPDMAWMPGAVLIAKSTYVWLAQLSRWHGRHIGRLDEIPDEELATLAHHGINTLWLIGVWSAAAPRAPSSNSAATTRQWPRRTRCSTIASPTILAASRLTSICAIAPIITEFALPATWCPTTWASTPVGHRAPRMVHLAMGTALPGISLRRPRPLT